MIKTKIKKWGSLALHPALDPAYATWKSKVCRVHSVTVSSKDHLRRIDTQLELQRAQLARLEEAVRSTSSQVKSEPPSKKWSKLVPWIALGLSLLSMIVSVISAYVAYTGQRAYVLLGKIAISCGACEHPVEAPKKFPAEANAAIILNVANYGKTPAYNLAINVSRFLAIDQLPPDFDFPEDPDGNSGPYPLPPDPSTPLTIEVPERAEDILSARHQIPMQRGPHGDVPNERFYIYGHFTFDDTFKRMHTVLYCRQFMPPDATLPERWAPCGPHEGEVASFTPKVQPHSSGFAVPKFYPPEPPDNRPPLLREAPTKP